MMLIELLFLYNKEMRVFISKKYVYCAMILVCGMHTHKQEAGNLLKGELEQDGDSRGSIVKRVPRKKECLSCKVDVKENENPLWTPCQKAHWLHDVCKLNSPFKKAPNFSRPSDFFQRNRSGLIPLSMAIFRGKKEIERENSRTIVAFITQHVGKNVFNMVTLCDHHKCSAWMHSIYCGDEVVVATILLAVERQTLLSAVERPTSDPEAVWKLLMNKDCGRYGLAALTPLMVAVRKKNIPVIKVLKGAAGSRMGEYLKVESGYKNTAIDFAGDDAEMLQLLLGEETIEL